MTRSILFAVAFVVAYGSVEGGGLGDVLSSVPWGIEKDSGRGKEQVPITDVAAFLAVADLKEHTERLDSEGIIVDDLPEVTDELLQQLGVSKIMHRKRFLRYARLMHVHAQQPPAPWVIKKDMGRGKEEIFIPDLQKFLEVADLEEHFEGLHGKGITVDNVHEVTNEMLDDAGMVKFMHKKRFLRYAEELHVQVQQDPAEVEKEKKWRQEKAAYDKKKLLERAARSTHDFNAQCTDEGRKRGACS